MVKKRSAKDDPKTKEFAKRIVDKYINVTPQLKNKLKEFKKISVEDKDSEIDTDVRNILSDHIADGYAMDKIISIDRVTMNTAYFRFIVNAVKYILGSEADVIDEGDIPEEKQKKQKREPRRNKVWHDANGKVYKRTNGRTWTFRELMFLKTAMDLNRNRGRIEDDFNSTDIFKARTKSSIFTMIQRLKKGTKKI